jgi:GAF domain-containing protein/nitrogen-specific signal transduction histidine kinase
MATPPDETTADSYAVIATLRAERDAALARETALAEVLDLINRSPDDPGRVFTAILERAHTLCGADAGALMRFDGTNFYAVATHGLPDEFETMLKQPFCGPSHERLILGDRIVHVEDARLAEWPTKGEVERAFVELTNLRTSLFVPLRKEGALLGFISADRHEVRSFTDTEISLLESFAAQAVIAMENARLLGELREALEEQTATSEVLRVINASPGSLEPVFNAMIEKATRLCQAQFGGLLVRDGEVFRLFVGDGRGTEGQPFRPDPGSALAQLIGGASVVHIADVADTEEYRARTASRVRLVEEFDARTTLFVALRKEDALLGVLTIFRREVRPFTDRQIGLVQNFAAQAVIAMENAGLIAETREGLERQTATAEVLQVINASPGDLKPVFDTILAKAHSLCDIAYGSFELYDGDQFRSVAERGLSEAFAEQLRRGYRASQSPATRPLLAGDRFTHIANAADIDFPVFRSAAELEGLRTVLFVPLRKDELLLGMIASARREVRPFSEKEIALLENFAAQAVIAMENARLITETREALEQQTATAEILQVINTSPGDLTPVFDAMLYKAMLLCEAAFGFMTVVEGERSRTVAARGVPPAYAAFRARNPTPANAPVAARIRKGEPFIHTVDLKAERFYEEGDPQRRAIVDLGGARSLLAVPLMRNQAVLGALQVYRTEVRQFTDNQVELLQNFAAQAVIAMENARLLAETREALEQQTATAEVLRVINTSPGDLAPVFDTMLQKATGLCAAAFGILWTFDGEHYHAVAFRNVPPAYSEFLRDPPPATPLTPLGRIAAGEAFAQIADMADEIYATGGPMFNRAVELGGFRTIVGVALRKDTVLLGAITIYRQEVQPFSDKQIALLQNFAAQAVVAMENARLLTEQRWALEQQTATAEVLQVINASPGNLTPVFDAMLEKAMRLCEAAFGYLLSYNGEQFQAVAHRGLPPRFAEYLPRMDRPGPTGAYARILSGAPLLHFTDLMDGDGYQTSPIRRALVNLGGARTSLIVAIRREDRLLGIFTIYRREIRQFSGKQVALVEGFAAQAAIAMENARLLNEVRQRQDELRITFENMGDGVAMFDEVPRLVAWNRKFQEMLDVPDTVLAERRTYADYIRYLTERGEYGPEADARTQLRHFEDRLREHYSFERTRPDGRVIEVRHNPVSDGGFVLIYADITERKRSEEEIRTARDAAEEASRTIEAAYRDLKSAQASLIQAEKMASLGQLTAGIAHEIKNPLNFVNNFAGLSMELLDELKETAAPGFAMLDEARRTEIDDLTRTLSGNLEKINEHGNRADAIVRSMLEHSRGGSGERRSVDLNGLVDEALNLAYHGARAQDQSFNITLQRDFGAGIAPITLAPQDVIRVLLNLFSNGFYAARRRQGVEPEAGFEPTLKVVTRGLGDAVEIRVRDNGIGIPAEVRDKLFQPFFTTKPTGEGTGLGLSISYDIVTQQHAGSITVDSKVGEYSEFTIRLPRNA